MHNEKLKLMFETARDAADIDLFCYSGLPSVGLAALVEIIAHSIHECTIKTLSNWYIYANRTMPYVDFDYQSLIDLAVGIKKEFISFILQKVNDIDSDYQPLTCRPISLRTFNIIMTEEVQKASPISAKLCKNLTKDNKGSGCFTAFQFDQNNIFLFAEKGFSDDWHIHINAFLNFMHLNKAVLS